ncbi:MAG: hypothetical protein J1F16_10610 [Muribaculaceae bacterium]|nr:hypothetical protein [Muribaculaceae bacterium]
MYRLDFDKGILGADGKIRYRLDFEDFFKAAFFDEIEAKLTVLHTDMHAKPGPYYRVFEKVVEEILNNLESLLLASPYSLNRVAKLWTALIVSWKSQPVIKPHIKEFKEDLSKAFRYAKFRKSELNRLALMLNVKTCLYCNQQYTVAFGASPDSPLEGLKLKNVTAFLQFDHFFDKSTYPLLSMSLYNLVPSCGVCNQKKSTKGYDLSVHPYVRGLSETIFFRIKDRSALTNPRAYDNLEIEIDTGTDPDVGMLVKDLKLEQRYGRFRDIVMQLECAKYVERYYSDLEAELTTGMGIAGDTVRRKELRRYLRGFREESEMNDEPLTKFRRDISILL